ncbi:MAG TPA: hypothetical protein PKE39_14905 [Ignavibacteria bacterium]|nr:hypothetical protein [Ignavibacteria bacterium]HMR00309.1 hypothetical protein [Ignavibacteria bacterium]
MLKYRIIMLLLAVFVASTFSQVKKTKDSKDNYSKIELSFNLGYSRPLLEAYGNNVTINSAEDQLFIDGKRLIDSDNFGTNTGYGVQTYLKYSLMKRGRVKALLNLGYNILKGNYPGPSDYDIGVRIQSFSVGIGSEVNPLGHNYAVYPAVFGLMRMNFMGGETYHKAGLDFFKVTPRYGYTAGFKMYFRVKNTIDMFAGYSYTYDNAWGKQTGDNEVTTDRTIVFRDEKSSSNGLTANRRVAYWGLYLGMNFFFK